MTRTELLNATRKVMTPPRDDGAAAFFEVPSRTLGATGVEVSSIGLAVEGLAQRASWDDSVRLIRRALDSGMTFLLGDPEEPACVGRLSAALRDGYRGKAFLAATLGPAGGAPLGRRIDQALSALGVEHLDLLELDCARPEEAEWLALQAARQAGKVSHFGLTLRDAPEGMFVSLAAEHGREFSLTLDAARLSVDLLEPGRDALERQALPLLLSERIAVLGRMPMESSSVTFSERLCYALTLPTSTVLLDLTTEAQLQHALRTARSFKPYAESAIGALLARAATAARTQGPRGGVFHPEPSSPGWHG